MDTDDDCPYTPLICSLRRMRHRLNRLETAMRVVMGLGLIAILGAFVG